MVDYETYCRIRDHLVRQQLNVAQTARALALDVRTGARLAEVEQFRARKAVPRASKLDRRAEGFRAPVGGAGRRA